MIRLDYGLKVIDLLPHRLTPHQAQTQSLVEPSNQNMHLSPDGIAHPIVKAGSGHVNGGPTKSQRASGATTPSEEVSSSSKKEERLSSKDVMALEHQHGAHK